MGNKRRDGWGRKDTQRHIPLINNKQQLGKLPIEGHVRRCLTTCSPLEVAACRIIGSAKKCCLFLIFGVEQMCTLIQTVNEVQEALV